MLSLDDLSIQDHITIKLASHIIFSLWFTPPPKLIKLVGPYECGFLVFTSICHEFNFVLINVKLANNYINQYQHFNSLLSKCNHVEHIV